MRFRLAFGLYWNGGRWVYDNGASRYWKNDSEYNEHIFELKKFIEHPPGYTMNCLDFSGAYSLLAQSLGHNALPLKIEAHSSNHQQVDFKTNHISGSGNDATLFIPGTTYKRWGFFYHQVAYLLGVVDASAAHWADLAGYGFANPPCGWSQSGYWQTPTITSYGDYLRLTYNYSMIPPGTGNGVPSTSPGPVTSYMQNNPIFAIE